MLDRIIEFALGPDTLLDVVHSGGLVERDTNGLLNIFSSSRPKACALQPNPVDGLGYRPVTLGNGVRQNVFVCEGACRKKTISADTDELRDSNEPTQ